MKKLITILAIMIVLVGAVFATDPLAANDKAQLTVNTEIKLQYPIYSLQATAWGTYGQGTNGDLGSADVMVHSENPLTPQDVRIGDDVLTEHDATITFTINQTNLSRIKGSYTLSVSAGNLIITKITNQDGSKTNASDAEKTANQFTVSAAPEIAGETVTNTTMTYPANGKIKIQYNGKKVGASDAVTPLATFSYTWSANESAAAGDYKADVTLTIESIQ